MIARVACTAMIALIFCSAASWAQPSPADIPAATFAQLNGFTNARISPDGATLAFLYPIDGRLNLVVHTLATQTNAVIPPIGGLDFNWMEWANNDTLIFSMTLSAVRDGFFMVETEETRLIALNVNSKKVTPLIKPAEVTGRTGSRVAKEYYAEAQIQDDVISWLPDDPDHILVALDEDFDARYEVRKVNVSTGSYSIYRKSIEGVQNWITDQANEVRLGFGYRLGELRMVFQDADGEWLDMGETDWYQNGWSPRSFTDDPEVILVSGYGGNGTRELRSLNTQTGEFIETLAANENYDLISTYYYPPYSKRVGAEFADPMSSIMYFDPEFAKLQAAIDKAVPGSRNEIQSISVDRSVVVVHSSNSREPGMLLVWDRKAKTMEPFGWYNEDLDSEMLADVTEVRYASDDGTVIPAFLTLPTNVEASALPAVVVPHGGPASRDDKSYWFLAQFLVSRGYAVLQPNFRGSTGYGWAFRNAGRGQWGGIMQDDVDAGARWLVEQGIADSDRICIVGWSYGGYSAAMGLVKSPELYRCGVGINGVYNLPQYIADAREYVGGTVWTRHIGLEGEKTRSVSPHHQADRFKAPFLIIHAVDDHRVRVGQADGLYEELKENDKAATLIKVEHGGHSMVTTEARQTILQTIEQFLSLSIGAP